MTPNDTSLKARPLKEESLALRISEWATSQSGQAALDSALKQSQAEASRLEQVQRIDPRSMLQLVTF